MAFREEIVQSIAEELDPEVFADHLPVPTRADTEAWYQRRQSAYALAGRIYDRLMEDGFHISDWSDAIDAMGEDA